MIKALIFDLDGTLADTLGAITEAINLTMDELSEERFTESEVKEFVNFDTRRYIYHALRDGDRSDERLDKVVKMYCDNYAKTYMHTDKTYDGIIPMLEELSRRGYRLGMLSNKADEYVLKLEHQLFRPGLFEISHGVRDGIPAKPYPDAPHELAAFFGVEPHECAFIGDSDIDVYTAKNSGMVALDICWGYRSEEFLWSVGAEYVAHTPNEIITILEEIAKND